MGCKKMVTLCLMGLCLSPIFSLRGNVGVEKQVVLSPSTTYVYSSESKKGMSPSTESSTPVTPDMLTRDEQRAYNRLSPAYKKIYLCVLTRREREQVAVFNRRGQNPHDAINRILAQNRKKHEGAHPEDGMSPAQSAAKRSKDGRKLYY